MKTHNHSNILTFGPSNIPTFGPSNLRWLGERFLIVFEETTSELWFGNRSTRSPLVTKPFPTIRTLEKLQVKTVIAKIQLTQLVEHDLNSTTQPASGRPKSPQGTP